MVYKVIYLARRRPDMPPGDFPAAWRAHSRLAATFSGSLGLHIRGVRQCVTHRIEGANRIFTADYDGSSILTMKSWPDLMAARFHPHALDELLEDEKRVFERPVDDWAMAIEEQVICDGEPQEHVLLSFLAPDPSSLASAEFAARSLEATSKLTGQVDEAVRIVWNRVVDPAKVYPFAAVAELWFADRGGLERAVRSSSVANLAAQGGIADASRSVHLPARLNLPS